MTEDIFQKRNLRPFVCIKSPLLTRSSCRAWLHRPCSTRAASSVTSELSRPAAASLQTKLNGEPGSPALSCSDSKRCQRGDDEYCGVLLRDYCVPSQNEVVSSNWQNVLASSRRERTLKRTISKQRSNHAATELTQSREYLDQCLGRTTHHHQTPVCRPLKFNLADAGDSGGGRRHAFGGEEFDSLSP